MMSFLISDIKQVIGDISNLDKKYTWPEIFILGIMLDTLGNNWNEDEEDGKMQIGFSNFIMDFKTVADSQESLLQALDGALGEYENSQSQDNVPDCWHESKEVLNIIMCPDEDVNKLNSITEVSNTLINWRLKIIESRKKQTMTDFLPLFKKAFEDYLSTCEEDVEKEKIKFKDLYSAAVKEAI